MVEVKGGCVGAGDATEKKKKSGSLPWSFFHLSLPPRPPSFLPNLETASPRDTTPPARPSPMPPARRAAAAAAATAALACLLVRRKGGGRSGAGGAGGRDRGGKRSRPGACPRAPRDLPPRPTAPPGPGPRAPILTHTTRHLFSLTQAPGAVSSAPAPPTAAARTILVACPVAATTEVKPLSVKSLAPLSAAPRTETTFVAWAYDEAPAPGAEVGCTAGTEVAFAEGERRERKGGGAAVSGGGRLKSRERARALPFSLPHPLCLSPSLPIPQATPSPCPAPPAPP